MPQQQSAQVTPAGQGSGIQKTPPPAVRLFRALPKAQRPGVKDGIGLHFQENDPAEETHSTFRLRRPSAHADYELRLGDVGVFYRIRGETVEVVPIGEKRGNRLLIGSEKFEA